MLGIQDCCSQHGEFETARVFAVLLAFHHAVFGRRESSREAFIVLAG